MIAPVRCRWLRLHSEAARLLGSQKSRRFCRIAKSPTSFDPASIASGCRQPLMSAPASVPRVARPSEATSFARSVHPSLVPYILLPFRIHHGCHLLHVVPYSHSCDLGTRQDTTASAGCPSGEARQEIRPGADEESPFGRGYVGCLSGGGCSAVLSGAYVGSPSGGIC